MAGRALGLSSIAVILNRYKECGTLLRNVPDMNCRNDDQEERPHANGLYFYQRTSFYTEKVLAGGALFPLGELFLCSTGVMTSKSFIYVPCPRLSIPLFWHRKCNCNRCRVIRCAQAQEDRCFIQQGGRSRGAFLQRARRRSGRQGAADREPCTPPIKS